MDGMSMWELDPAHTTIEYAQAVKHTLEQGRTAETAAADTKA